MLAHEAHRQASSRAGRILFAARLSHELVTRLICLELTFRLHTSQLRNLARVKSRRASGGRPVTRGRDRGRRLPPIIPGGPLWVIIYGLRNARGDGGHIHLGFTLGLWNRTACEARQALRE
jgi:hypothetical protein